jgi:hypothetical protein
MLVNIQCRLEQPTAKRGTASRGIPLAHASGVNPHHLQVTALVSDVWTGFSFKNLQKRLGFLKVFSGKRLFLTKPTNRNRDPFRFFQ